MKIYKTDTSIVVDHNGDLFQCDGTGWDHFINRRHLFESITADIKLLKPDNSLSEIIKNNSVAPIGKQEVWAAGVTYTRSREARMEEAKEAGGGDFYARVYEAERPELFFKSPSYRVVGDRSQVRIRKDSKWNVPEPELTLFICSEGTIEGYTIGNDMSSRDIEGENPLYLPQAKCYDGSAALGPCLYVSQTPINQDTIIRLEIKRNEQKVFSGQIAINRMKRKHTELAEYLFRATSFPYGVYLMTGTGIVPPDDFTLESNDEIKISIDGIGVLVNRVTQ